MFERRREGEVQSVVTHVRVLAAPTHVDVRLVPVVLANDGTAQRHQRFGVKAPKQKCASHDFNFENLCCECLGVALPFHSRTVHALKP